MSTFGNRTRWSSDEFSVIENARFLLPTIPQRELAGAIYYASNGLPMNTLYISRSWFSIYFQVRKFDAAATYSVFAPV